MSITTTATTAAAPVEGTTTQTPAETPKETQESGQKAQEKDQFAEKLELLARKERALYRQRMEIENKHKSISEMEARIKAFEEKKAQAKKQPLDYLSEAGLSYDELTQFMLNGGKPTEKDEIQAVRDQFEAFRKQQEDKEKKQDEERQAAQKQAELQAIETFKEEIGQFIEENKQTYELSAQRDATEDIFTTINDAYVISLNEWNKNGRVGRPPGPMSIKDAADLVEEFYEKEVMRLTETEKWKKRQAQAQQAQEGTTQGSSQRPKEASKTLNNNMSSSVASVLPAKNEQDRMRRALEKLGG